jgi:hypothetical protein
MKNKIILFSLVLVALFGVSCKKKEAPQVHEIEVVAADSDGLGYGFVLQVNCSFYTLETNTGEETDKTKWAAAMSLGERVRTGQVRKLTFSDGKVYEFLEIHRDNGSIGYTFTNRVALGGRLAVVVDDNGANLYRTPKAVDVSGVILSRKTVAVYYPETEVSGFVKVRALDPVRDAYVRTDNDYVRRNSLSFKESDIESSILLQTALTMKNEGAEKVRKDALLKSALDGFPDSVFYNEINEIVNPGSTPQAATVKTEPISHLLTGTINDDNVNVRDFPGTTGKVVGTLNQYQNVTITEQTTETFVVGGQTERWFKITSPVEGWVFGAFVDYLP